MRSKRPFKKFFISGLFALTLMGAITCGERINLDYPTPSATTELNKLFPESLGGLEPSFMNLESEKMEGMRAVYGTDTVIIDILYDEMGVAKDLYFSKRVSKELEDARSQSRSRAGDVFYTRGVTANGSQNIYWSRGKWVFAIRASTIEFFYEALDNFSFISRG